MCEGYLNISLSVVSISGCIAIFCACFVPISYINMSAGCAATLLMYTNGCAHMLLCDHIQVYLLVYSTLFCSFSPILLRFLQPMKYSCIVLLLSGQGRSSRISVCVNRDEVMSRLSQVRVLIASIIFYVVSIVATTPWNVWVRGKSYWTYTMFMLSNNILLRWSARAIVL